MTTGDPFYYTNNEALSRTLLIVMTPAILFIMQCQGFIYGAQITNNESQPIVLHSACDLRLRAPLRLCTLGDIL
jgi:hypothetical protein